MRFAQRLGWSTLVVAVVCTGAASRAADVQPALPGRTIDDFKLNDALGAKRSLSEWKDSKAIVIVFLGTECPISKRYAPRLNELASEAVRPPPAQRVELH